MLSRLSAKLLLAFTVVLCGMIMPAPVFAAQVTDYQDIDRNHWAYSYVKDVLEQGLFLGTDNTTFEPETTMSRAMFLTVLYRYDGAGAGADAGAPDVYADVPADTWYAEAVNWAASLGLLEDIAEENFYPETPITREDMMALLYRYFNSNGLTMPTASSSSLGTSFSDFMQINPYAYEAVVAGCWARIMDGFPDGRFLPQGESTRAQVAAVFSRIQIWQQTQQNTPHASNSTTVLEQYPLPDEIYNISDMLITKNGFLAAYSYQGRAFLYDLNTRRMVANLEVEGLYCRHIAADESGVTFYIVQEEEYPDITAIGSLHIRWQGETDLQHLDAFQLPFGNGFIVEWEGEIAYLDPQTEQRTTLARFTEEVEENMGSPDHLVLYDVIDDHRFIYAAKLDFWSLRTYVYDIRTKQSTPAPFNIPLGIENSRLLGSFGDYGLEGMVVADLDTLEAVSTIYYNDAGSSRADLSADGSLVLAIYHRGEHEKGLLLFATQTGQLLQTYELDAPGGSVYIYGFWQQRPYFLYVGNSGQTTLYILPENMASLDTKPVGLEQIISMQPGSTALIIKDDGSVWFQDMYNYNENPMIKEMDNGKAVWKQQFVSFALDSNNTLWGWGGIIDNPVGADTGNLEYPYYAAEPTPVLADVKSFNTDACSLAVKKDGSLWAWGSVPAAFANDKHAGNFGNFPHKIMDNVRMACSSYSYGLAIKADNSLWSWFSSTNPATGDLEHIPFKLMEDVEYIDYGLAIKSDGSLWRFVPDDTGEKPLAPQKIISDITAISRSWDYYLALDKANQLWAWPADEKEPTPFKVAENCSYMVESWFDDTIFMIDKNGTLIALILDGTNIKTVAIEDDVLYAATSVDRILVYVRPDGSLWRIDFSTFLEVEGGVTLQERTGEIRADAPRNKVMDKVFIPK